MEKVKAMIKQLQATSSRNEKVAILEANKDNELWTAVLKFLFDPMVTTGISAAKLSKQVGVTDQISTVVELMEYLRQNNTGRDVDVAAVRGFLRGCPDHVSWIEQLVTKSLKLGVDVSSINKVYGKGFIKVFSVMLAESFADNSNHLDGKQFIITQKLDGLRCVAFVHQSGTVEFFTRSGQNYGEIPDVAADLLSIPVRNVAYDGELIAVSKSKDAGEVFRETSSAARTDGAKTGLIYHVFDRVPLPDFLDGYCETPCIDRKLRLAVDVQTLTWVQAVKILYAGSDQEMISSWMSEAEKCGWEGLMLNDYEAPYRSKRVRDLLKVKKFKTADVRVTGVYEGEGDLAGTLGGINCEFELDGETYQTKCGSGFKKEQRDKYWTNPDQLIGKIVELKYFEISKNRDGGRSLRFPVWLDIIRFDKDTTSVK